jgi:hypothetical protein
MTRRGLVVAFGAFVAFGACEHDGTSPAKKQPVVPDPVKQTPVEIARAEFELIPGDFAIGTSKLYSRGDFLDEPFGEAAFDQGDFIGRLRTLFGARPGDEYVLRHKATGFVITAYAGASGPSYGGGPNYRGALGAPPAPKDALTRITDGRGNIQARIAADPILAAGSPMAELATAKTNDQREAISKRVARFNRHMADAMAPVGFPPVASELERLVEAVPPADWEVTRYDEDSNTVDRAGAAHGESFTEELEPEAGLAFLLDTAEHRDPAARDAIGGIPWDADSHVLYYFAAHPELASFAPRVRTAWQRLARSTRSYDGDLRASLSDEVRSFATKLHIPANEVTAALR